MSLLNFKLHKTDWKLIAYIIFCFIFLLVFGIRAVKGEIDFECYADSETYLEIADDSKWTLDKILLIQPNVLGPTLILRLVNSSFFIVYLMNTFIVFSLYRILIKYYNIDRSVLFFYILISPLFFSSLILINKEMISLMAMALLFMFMKSRNYLHLLLAILVSLLVRWQMALFVVLIPILWGNLNFLRRFKIVTLVVFLVGISFAYYSNLDKFQHINDVLEMAKGEKGGGSGVFFTFVDIQNGSPIG